MKKSKTEILNEIFIKKLFEDKNLTLNKIVNKAAVKLFKIDEELDSIHNQLNSQQIKILIFKIRPYNICEFRKIFAFAENQYKNLIN